VSKLLCLISANRRNRLNFKLEVTDLTQPIIVLVTCRSDWTD